MTTTEERVRELARLAAEAYEQGSPETGNSYVAEAVGELAELAGVDATELVELLLTNGLR